MMEGLENERSICSSSPYPWLNHPKPEASTLLWKLKDCFSTYETTSLHHRDKEVSVYPSTGQISVHVGAGISRGGSPGDAAVNFKFSF